MMHDFCRTCSPLKVQIHLVTINLVLLDIRRKAFTPKIRTFEFVVQVDFAYMLDVDSLGINVKVRLLLPSPMLFMSGLF